VVENKTLKLSYDFIINKPLTGFSGFVELAGSLYDYVAHRSDQSQSRRGLKRAICRAVHAVSQRLQVTRVWRLCGHRQWDDSVTCNIQHSD